MDLEKISKELELGREKKRLYKFKQILNEISELQKQKVNNYREILSELGSRGHNPKRFVEVVSISKNQKSKCMQAFDYASYVQEGWYTFTFSLSGILSFEGDVMENLSRYEQTRLISRKLTIEKFSDAASYLAQVLGSKKIGEEPIEEENKKINLLEYELFSIAREDAQKREEGPLEKRIKGVILEMLPMIKVK